MNNAFPKLTITVKFRNYIFQSYWTVQLETIKFRKNENIIYLVWSEGGNFEHFHPKEKKI